MKFEMKKPIFECPYCHEKIEGDYAAYQEHVQVWITMRKPVFVCIVTKMIIRRFALSL